MDEHVTSPPNPPITATSATLYRSLVGLRMWVVEQVDKIRQEVPQSYAKSLKDPAPIPNEAVWGVVSVMDKYVALMYARMIRESWDEILREHETDWSDRIAVQKRFYLLHTVLHMLREAFVDHETREARHAQRMEDRHKQIQHYRQMLMESPFAFGVEPENLDDEEPEDDEEDDDARGDEFHDSSW